MSLISSMDALRAYLLNASITGLDEFNCSVDDETIFNSIIMRDNPEEQRGLIISFGGMRRPLNQTSEFGGSLQRWILIVNLFVLLWGSKEERSEAIREAWRFVDEVSNVMVSDSTLDGQVMDAFVTAIDEPALYTRQQMNEYIMVPMVITVTENLYG